MKQRPERYDDFISSAGVPTIPLKAAKKRSFANTLVYALIAIAIITVMLIGHELIYSLMYGFMVLYFGAGIVVSGLLAIFGVVLKKKWLFLIGLLSSAVIIGFALADISYGVSIAGSLMIAVFVYRWYSAKYHYVSVSWPLFVGVLGLIFGLLLIVVQLQIIAVIIIAPVLLVITSVMIIWDLWKVLSIGFRNSNK
ncbi:MAG: hypothetical protein ACO3F2_10670 [Roseiflexaceae bacterium]